MALIRILVIALVVWLLIRMLRNWMDRKAVKRSTTPEQINTVVRCAHCGLHIPQQEAIQVEGHYYCCKEHGKIHRQEHR